MSCVNSEGETPLPHARFTGLTYEKFRELATDETLSVHERIGFPDDYREGAEVAILADIESKMPGLMTPGTRVADIGCGAGPLATTVIERCAERNQYLVLADSPEMLALLPDAPHVTKAPGRFPDSPGLLPDLQGCIDAVIVYSVLQIVHAEGSTDAFIDAAVSLLAPGGRLIIGDLPNVSMRARFLSSDAGRAHHRAYTGRDEDPEIPSAQATDFDDDGLLGIVRSARARGFDAWVVPQPLTLPLGNRREDILIGRP